MEMACNDGGGPTCRSGGTGNRGREVYGTILCRQYRGVIEGSGVASGSPKRAHWPIPMVRTGR